MSAPQILAGSDPAQTAATCQTYNLTTTEFSELRKRAVDAKASAYCVYSRFRVGATLLCAAAEGDAAAAAVYVAGANVENASYPVGTCAERVAFGTAVTQGVKKFRAVAVATDISPPASPCGMCRQFIREFCSMDVPVIMFDKNGDYIVQTLQQLLPMSFGPDDLPPVGAPGY